ncbi:hypothetical protein ILUMI_00767 [Ignelater luminosus]|uniref:Uncharacterized protein n=1 Tax=Ignelater luminosus TaxID=2038154 RepID=A0A8K0GI38_IGNLU|nr:hypothetical protein ILUMI_00767 [Ignelater luminosus]
MVFTTCSNKDDIALIDNLLRDFMADSPKFNDFIKHSLIFACVQLVEAFSGDAAGREEVVELLQRLEVKNICGTLKQFVIVLKDLGNSMESNKPEYSSYWTDTGHVKNFESLFIDPSIQEKIEQVFTTDGKIKEIRMVKSVTFKNITSLNELISSEYNKSSEEIGDLFLQFLADSGYFNIFQVDS